MFLDVAGDIAGGRTGQMPARATGRASRFPAFSVLVPFFNEAGFLPATIASLAQQSERFTLILVDNGSTDDSAAVARRAAQDHGLDFLLVTETNAGKVAALRAGLAWVRTRWVATCDADTLYPPHYLSAARQLLERDGCVVAGAYFVAPGADTAALDEEARRILAGARFLPHQCHAGGAGQVFDVAALRAVGGFDPAIWPWVLEDHEVIHRTMKRGTMLYSKELWCAPAPRERDRESIRWTLAERLAYAATAPVARGWFFYRFLGPRLARRRLASHRIRERAFHHLADHAEGCLRAAPDPVC